MHTAGVIAAWYGKESIIIHLVKSYNLSETAVRPCKVCLFCSGLSFFDNNDCAHDHQVSYCVALAHGAAAGGQVQVLRSLQQRGVDMNEEDTVSSWQPVSLADALCERLLGPCRMNAHH